MLDHHLQRQIVEKLKSSDSLTFTELKPDDLDNKLFTYHLKATIRENFVEKTSEGHYRLTQAGQNLWKRMSEDAVQISQRAFSVLYIAVHHAHNGWLIYRRKNHPFKDKTGFMHALPKNNASASEQAERELHTKTGLSGTCSVIGSGFFRTINKTTTEGFVNFTLLLCEDVSGELSENDDSAEYFWTKSISATDPDILPNMALLLEAMSEGRYPFFLDEVVLSS